MVFQGNARHDRDRVLPVVHVRDESSQVPVYEIGKSLVPDARHAVGDHSDVHILAKIQAEVDAIEKGKRST